MKKITYILGLLLLVVTSCNQDFLDNKPLDEYSEVDVWSDPALIETFVNNFYREGLVYHAEAYGKLNQTHELENSGFPDVLKHQQQN